MYFTIMHLCLYIKMKYENNIKLFTKLVKITVDFYLFAIIIKYIIKNLEFVIFEFG